MMDKIIFAERNVLGAIGIVGASAYHRVAGLVSESDFSDSNHRTMFRAIQSLVKEGDPVDLGTLTLALSGDHSTILKEFVNSTMAPANAELYAKVIREGSQKRQVMKILGEAMSADDQKTSLELTTEVASKLESVMHQQSGEAESFAQAYGAAIEAIDNASAGTGFVGVPTGLKSIDNRIGGLQAPRLIVVAARPSIGKTALVNQIALYAASQNYPVGICSLEMGSAELVIRAMANRYKLNGSALSFGSEEEIQKLTDQAAKNPISNLPIWIDAETFSLNAITARITEWKRNHDIKLAVVDHIGLVEVDGAHSVNERLGLISRALKKLAKRLNIPVIAVSQLNRNVEKEKRWPMLSDLRDSGSIEQDADICLFLHADAGTEGASLIPMHMGLLKNRVGRRGWLNDRFVFNGSTQTFYVEGAIEGST